MEITKGYLRAHQVVANLVAKLKGNLFVRISSLNVYERSAGALIYIGITGLSASGPGDSILSSFVMIFDFIQGEKQGSWAGIFDHSSAEIGVDFKNMTSWYVMCRITAFSLDAISRIVQKHFPTSVLLLLEIFYPVLEI